MKKKNKLENLERKEVFTTPDNYFETLPNRIQERIALETPKPDRSVRKLIPNKIYYIAASVAVFLIASVLLFRVPEENASAQNILAEVSTEELIEYLELSDISVTEITFSVDEQQQLLDSQWDNLVIPEDYVNEITTEELEEYL